MFQEKRRTPLAWAFQRDSELLPIFNHYLEKMQQTGVIDRLKQTFLGNHNGITGSSKIQELQGLGYDTVVLPFLALLIGLCAALLQLGIEAMSTICKKKCSKDEEQSKEDDSISEEEKEMIDEINHLLMENCCKLGGKKFLTKMKMLSTHKE